jgi:hypothetical protein
MATRTIVLDLYRNILRHARAATTPQGQISYLEQAKAAFRQHSTESEPEAIQTLINKAQSKLGFLKVITPRLRRTATSGKQNFVFRDGEGLVETTSSKLRKTSFRDDRIDPEDIARHNRLLERQRFMGRDKPLRYGGNR